MQRDIAREDDANSTRLLKEAGAKLNVLTDAQIEDWRAAAAPEVARCRARLDDDLLALFEENPAMTAMQNTHAAQRGAMIDGGHK